MLGGLAASVLSGPIGTEPLLWIVALLNMLAIVQLRVLGRTEAPLPNEPPTAGRSHWGGLKSFPELVARYPIIRYLACSIFLFIALYTIAEFLYLSIYAEAFPDERKLTSFLGLIRMLSDAAQVLLLVGLTRPLLDRLGVARMSVIYPITTLLSFVWLAGQFRLPAAIASNLNSGPLENALHQPVHHLTYNAIPHRFVGRVRAFCEGGIYALGLAFAGVLLWLGQRHLTLVQLTWIGVALCGFYVATKYVLSKQYVTSLISMLRDGVVHLV